MNEANCSNSKEKIWLQIFKVPQGDNEWDYKWRKDTDAGTTNPGSILLFILNNYLRSNVKSSTVTSSSYLI